MTDYIYFNIMKKFTCTVWHKIVAAVYFCGFAIFRVLRELIFAIRIDWFILTGINFCNFQKVQEKSLIIFSLLLSACNGSTLLFSNNLGMCIPCVKQVKQITFFCPSITITSAVTY